MSKNGHFAAQVPEAKKMFSQAMTSKPEHPQCIKFPINRNKYLQRSIGNEVLERILTRRTIQTKLAIGQPNDIYEQVADRVAEEIINMPEHVVRPKTSNLPYTNNIKVGEVEHPRSRPHFITGLIQYQEDEMEKDERIQTKLNDCKLSTASTQFEHLFQMTKGNGQALDKATQRYFESHFGNDFSAIRIHNDTNAIQLNKELNSQAFTLGNDVFFNHGTYNPESAQGKQLLAHELTHVVQQGAATSMDHNCQATLIQRHAPDIEDNIHQGLIEEFRQEMGYPPERINQETGSPEGPTDAELKYGGILNEWLQSRNQTSSTTLSSPQSLQQAAPQPPNNLQISGPNSVDHYCAAYTPNQSANSNDVASSIATCGVYPARNITLSVSGMARGQGIVWRITNGSNRVRIIGQNNRPTVTIQGILMSANPNDVTIQATSGANTATHQLTVRQPFSLTSSPLRSSVSATAVSADLLYTVRDKFNNAMGSDICIDETVIECDSPFVPGVIQYNFNDASTNAQGQAVDHITVSNPSGIPRGFCVKLDQDITAGGCGPLGRNIILIQSTGITVRPGDCTPGPNSTCP
jgi:hypothetical protein